MTVSAVLCLTLVALLAEAGPEHRLKVLYLASLAEALEASMSVLVYDGVKLAVIAHSTRSSVRGPRDPFARR